MEAGAASTAELFADYVEAGGREANCIALAVGRQFAGPDERNALEKSLEALGYGRKACTYAALRPDGPDAPPALDAQALFVLVEGLDPLCVLALDQASAEALGQAYRTSFETDAAIRVFGRPAVAFADLASLLGSDAGKQAAWALLKSLPRRS